MCFGVAHDVEIDEFFEFHGFDGDIFEYIHEEGRDIFAVGHVRDDASDGFLFLIEVIAVKFISEFPDLPRFPFGSVTHLK